MQWPLPALPVGQARLGCAKSGRRAGAPTPDIRRPQEIFAGFFPGAAALGETLAYFETYTYLGPHSFDDDIAPANKVAGKKPATFATWARENFRLKTAAPA